MKIDLSTLFYFFSFSGYNFIAKQNSDMERVGKTKFDDSLNHRTKVRADRGQIKLLSTKTLKIPKNTPPEFLATSCNFAKFP